MKIYSHSFRLIEILHYLCRVLLNEATWNYVLQHADEDVRKVALQGAKDPEVDLTIALQQIAGRQAARKKLPSWAAVEGIVYPPHLNMEQCSSEQTARYKAQLAGEGESMVDLTGGFGVDFYWMSQGYRHRSYIEQDEQICAISSENFRLLGHDCDVVCGSASDYLKEMPRVSLVYLDPARRNEHGGRTYSIEDCNPNVLELLPLLMEKADRVMLKLSPMLDWRKAVADLQHVSEVHIISVDNECKELLLVLGKEPAEGLRLCCVNNGGTFEVLNRNVSSLRITTEGSSVVIRFSANWEEAAFLYEPNASIMKAGCFAELCERYPVEQVAQNSHLFLSSVEIDDFPGRSFRIEAISSMNKQETSQKVSALKSANISVRNFPLTADQLRKKLKLKDGGNAYIFATTVLNGGHKLFICRKIS